MQKLEFGEALDLILATDPRYDRAAYDFLRDALDATIKQRKKAREGEGHVSGQQLLDGIRVHALREFGPMVTTVFDYWGVKCGQDFGEMVFNLIRIGIFGKSETDSIEDFKGGYDFQTAFDLPYQPAHPAPLRRVAADQRAEELQK